MSNVIELHPGLKPDRNKPYFVYPHEGRYLVVRAINPGSNQYAAIEDCRTARFAQEVADSLNRDATKSPTLQKYHGTEYRNQG